MNFRVPVNCKLEGCNCNWLIPVSSLDAIGYPDYNHAYILPNGEVYILDSNGELMVLNGSGSAYELPVATKEVLGGVKEGKNVTISEDGTLSVETIKGDKGDTGAKGDTGEKGEKGDTGATINYTSGLGISIDSDNKISNTGQASKVTNDNGSALLQVSDTGTILSTIVAAGAGIRTGTASAKVSDNPTSTNLIMFVANMVTNSGGYVIGTNTAGVTWTRVISARAWYGDWQKITSNSLPTEVTLCFESLNIIGRISSTSGEVMNLAFTHTSPLNVVPLIDIAKTQVVNLSMGQDFLDISKVAVLQDTIQPATTTLGITNFVANLSLMDSVSNNAYIDLYITYESKSYHILKKITIQ